MDGTGELIQITIGAFSLCLLQGLDIKQRRGYSNRLTSAVGYITLHDNETKIL